MRIRGLLVGLGVAAVLGGLVYWSNKAKQGEANKPAADAAPKLLSIPEDQITKVEIKRAAGETATVVQKAGARWELAAPEKLAVDQDAMSSMVSTLSSLSSDRLVEEKAGDLKEYGLASPGIAVVVHKKDGKKQELLIGDETPTSSGFFAKLEGDPRIFTIASWNKTSLDKTSKDLRDKRLLTFDSDKLTRVELVAQGQALEFGKNNQNEWQILKPKPLRADGGQVEELIRKLKDAKMDTSVPDEEAKKAADAFDEAKQVALARVSDAAGTQELRVRKDKDNNYYARSSVVAGVYRVASDVGTGLDKGLSDFRNKKVFDFGWNDPSKVEIREGGKQTVLQKTGDKWSSGTRQMDSSSVQAVVDKLRGLEAASFPEKPFSAPAMELTVTSADGKRVEKAALAKAGNDWLARRENEPTVYQLDAKVVEELQKALAAVKEAAPVKK
jgi:hypothetical protein